jgi:multiple sugar transport system permease protein
MTAASPSAAINGISRRRARKVRGGSNGSRQRRAAYLFVLPFVVVFAAMFLAPLGYAAYLSLFRTQLIGGTVFVGLTNYTTAITDSQFLGGVWRILQFFVYQVPIMLVLAVTFALVLDSGRLRVPRLFRIVFFVPYAVPAVVGALIWGYIYGPRFGPFAQIARYLGLGAPGFLTTGGILPSLANIQIWEFTGYNMIIFYAALRAIPTEQYEAATVDGAGAFKTALYIKLPQLKPALVLTLFFSVIGAFQLFNEPSVLQPVAGPVISSNFTPNFYAYTLAFTNQNVNYAAAVSFLLGFVILAATYLGIGVATLQRRRTP